MLFKKSNQELLSIYHILTNKIEEFCLIKQMEPAPCFLIILQISIRLMIDLLIQSSKVDYIIMSPLLQLVNQEDHRVDMKKLLSIKA